MQFALRVIRKLANIGHKITYKMAVLFARIEDKSLRILLGTDYSVRARSEMTFEEKIYSSIPLIVPLNPSLPAIGRPAKVALVVPSLTSRGFYGGVATALIFAAKLAERHHMPLRIIQTSETGDGRGLEQFFTANGIAIDAASVELIDISARRYNIYGYLDMRPDDIFIVSAWWDAQLIEQLPLTHKFIYLIQDFEPIFYANGDMAVLAENTYRTNRFIPVCNTELMYKFMTHQGYDYIKDNGLWFEPAVSRLASGKAVDNTGKKKQLFLYGRPNVERNLFHLSLDALNRAFSDGGLVASEWEIWMAGQNNLPNIKLSSGAIIKNLGKMGMDEYITFSKTIDVALTPMMAPHPNYPTLEFASIGSAVVTTKYVTKHDLSNYSDNIVITDLSVEAITAGIKKAASMSYETRMKNLATTTIADNWDKTLAHTLKGVDEQLEQYLKFD